MPLIILFILSGTVLAVLLVAKRIEEKRKRDLLILNLISKGDTRVRELHHEAVRFYSIGKERAHFFISKQLPMRSRSSLNKIIAYLEQITDKHFENLRDSRLLRKSDGISEYFKTISEVEKGAGEINEEIYTEETNLTETSIVEETVPEIQLVVEETPIEEVAPEVEITFVPEEEPREEPVLSSITVESIIKEKKAKKHSKPKVTRAKKVKVAETPVAKAPSPAKPKAQRKRRVKLVVNEEL